MQTKLSLPDMLTLVPHLLATCSLQAGVKLLRILSKEIDGLAMGAVKSCSVKFGTGTALHAEVPILSQRMINLMSLSNLLTLDVIIITTTGELGCGAHEFSHQLEPSFEYRSRFLTTEVA